ncbi:hypothetical protein [Pseudonocardia asaccharolytica]|uniref:Integrase n=1 Tax=Pseudonocardia asaccharolytica DSM 44247 = NBRC 16224 TaxID=1123024 RepID=A0A511D1E0_9PSEU|nr:hypothetical protein [Pseudonocardia asaccharolytica]GEL18606.1 hypothetical protein PA7_24430 [Pseudonocardia asaccharolytica DSM 44247 = NBRC 16224]
MHNVRRSFRKVVAAARLDLKDWTPLEHVSRLVEHSGTAVTEAVYRQQLRPVLEDGATAMDTIFPISDAG